MTKKRLIEEVFPIKEISKESVNEKNSRQISPSNIHLWWARRPLVASRATEYASLITPKSKSDISKEIEFLKQLSEWREFNSLTKLTNAREAIIGKKSKNVKILDPFAGGGSLPLEAWKLGCETYASDYNPVACIILKSLLEFPQVLSMEKNNITSHKDELLVKEIKFWSDWICSELKKDFDSLYSDQNKTKIHAFLWTRIIECPNTSCKHEIPTVKQFWLSKKQKKKVCFYPYFRNKSIMFKILGTGYEPIPKEFNPSNGTISKANLTCIKCGYTIDGKTTRKLFYDNKYKEKMICKLSIINKYKTYSSINEFDIKKYSLVEKKLNKQIKKLAKIIPFSPLPDEVIFTPTGREYTSGSPLYNFTPIMLYGLTKWKDLFNQRQQLAFLLIIEKIRIVHDLISKKTNNSTLAKSVIVYLSLSLSRHISYNAKLSWWEPLGERCFNVFGRQALPMVFDYAEQNPFSTLTGNLPTQFNKTAKIVNEIMSTSSSAKTFVRRSSATSLPYENNYFDAIFTDPPYYDNVPYAVLSDFFYIWLKRTVGFLFTDLFSTPLVPKNYEVISEVPLLRGLKKELAYQLPNVKTKEFFESSLIQSFQEFYRILKDDGICIIVYAHKSTDGWETLIRSILESGFVISSTLPINTEMTTRLRANESASLASSIYMIARKWKKEPIGFYQGVKKELREYLDKRLVQLSSARISGADFFIAAIGSAIEVFGKYEKVTDDADNPISVMQLLEDTREIVTNYAIKQVLHSEFSDQISQMTRFYILWRWAFGDSKIPFDDALRMSQSVGIDLPHEWNKGFIVKESENIRLLQPDERKIKELENSQELIDILHLTLLLWKNKKKDDLNKLLKEKGLDKSYLFKKVGHAISQSLPQENKEKKWLDGFFTRFEVDDSQPRTQTKLF